MERNKNSIFTRVLSFLMVLAMLLPFVGLVVPVKASAEEASAIGGAPMVELSWGDEVVVLDGVATPYKSASSTASS